MEDAYLPSIIFHVSIYYSKFVESRFKIGTCFSFRNAHDVFSVYMVVVLWVKICGESCNEKKKKYISFVSPRKKKKIMNTLPGQSTV